MIYHQSICIVLILIITIKILYPINKCDIVISCNTGLGDLIYETFSAVAIAKLSGCIHSNVIANFNRGHGHYNLSRIKSPYFTFVPREHYSWFSKPEFVLPFGNTPFTKQCGIKDDYWISYYTGNDAALARYALRQISSSISIDSCSDTQSIIGVHSRRGDKITHNWSSTSSLDYIYKYFLQWARSNNVQRISLTTDDHKWANIYIHKLHQNGIHVSYNLTNSAINDLCILKNSNTIIRLGTSSTFSAIASIISNKRLYVIPPNHKDNQSVNDYNRNWKMVDSHWVNSGLLKIHNI